MNAPMLPQDNDDGEEEEDIADADAKEPFTPPPKSASFWLAETIRLLRKCADQQLSLNLQLARWIYLAASFFHPSAAAAAAAAAVHWKAKAGHVS